MRRWTETLFCTTPPEKVLIRRRIPCSEDAGPGAQVASDQETLRHQTIISDSHEGFAHGTVKPAACRARRQPLQT